MDIVVAFANDLLLLLFSATMNWGYAIISFTIVLKLTLLPVQKMSFTYQEKMRELKPKLDEYLEAYRNKPTKLAKLTSELKKRHGVSGWSFFLPAVVQGAIALIAYHALTQVKFVGTSEFLWLPSLSLADPYFILPVLVAMTTFLQFRFNKFEGPKGASRLLSVVFPGLSFVFLMGLPSALSLYYLIGSLFQIVSQGAFSRFVS